MELGIKIKQLRQQCGLTQEELGSRCDLTKGYISQLENELTSPSITTLTDILSALGTTLGEFFKDDTPEQLVFTPDDYFEKSDENGKIVWLVPNAQKNEMEATMVTIAPKTKLSQDVPHDGEEFGYVLSGEIILHLGSRAEKVVQGSSFYFVCGKPHYLENRSAKPARLLWVSSPPTF